MAVGVAWNVTVCGNPAAFTAGRQARAENAVRRIGAPSSVVKTSAPADQVFRCAPRAPTTTWGSGIVRIDAGVFGAARYGDKPDVDHLISHGMLENDGQRVSVADVGGFAVLQHLFEFDTASYYHYSQKTRVAMDQMVDDGWLELRSSLLTEPEVNHIDYCLNAEYSNGLDLRGRYLHGTDDATSGEAEYSRVYVTVLKLPIALVMEINDEFWLREIDKITGAPTQGIASLIGGRMVTPTSSNAALTTV